MAGGIFCIENWSGDLRSSATVRPLLDFLERTGSARVVHQRVSTPRELHHYLARFAALDGYRVGYLAAHGKRGRVFVGPHAMTLETLGTWARLDDGELTHDPGVDDAASFAVDLEGKVLYLGSCATLRISERRLEELRDRTGALAICGYTKNVEWFASGAFDVMLLSALAGATGAASSRAVPHAIRRLWRDSGDLLGTLGFRCFPDWRPTSKA